MMTMMMICIVWLLRPTTLPKSAVLVGGVGVWGVARAAWPALVWSNTGGNQATGSCRHSLRTLAPLYSFALVAMLCHSYLLESTIGEQLERLPVQPLRNNQVFPTSVKSAKSDYYLIFGKIWVANDETCRLSFSFSKVPRHFNSADHKVLYCTIAHMNKLVI